MDLSQRTGSNRPILKGAVGAVFSHLTTFLGEQVQEGHWSINRSYHTSRVLLGLRAGHLDLLDHSPSLEVPPQGLNTSNSAFNTNGTGSSGGGSYTGAVGPSSVMANLQVLNSTGGMEEVLGFAADYFNMSAFGEGGHGGGMPASPFDDVYIRTVFMILYAAVFAGCFIGNLLVIIVVLGHSRMRTTTNFFLANLALADLSVGIFCVLPNLGLYLSPHWILGKAMCKLLYFVQMMAYAASIIILTVISIERYFAIIHPFRCKQWNTFRLLRMIVLLIWLASAICGIPQMIFYNTVSVPQGDDVTDFCIVLTSHNKKAYVTTNFVLWYLVPLSLMTIMYTRISVVLWRTSRLERTPDRSLHKWTWKSSKQPCKVDQTGEVSLGFHGDRERETSTAASTIAAEASSSYSGVNEKETSDFIKHRSSMTSSSSDSDSSCGCFVAARGSLSQERADSLADLNRGEKQRFSCFPAATSEKNKMNGSKIGKLNIGPTSNDKIELRSLVPQHSIDCPKKDNDPPKPVLRVNRSTNPKIMRLTHADRSEGALIARRRVIRLLIVVIVCFALCVLPYHLLMMCQNWLEYGIQHTYGQMLASPIVFLIFYLNSALNPLLYAFLSDNFRRSLHELIHGQASSTNLNRARQGTLTGKTQNSCV